MFCNNCGKEITEDAKFCPYCGQANSKPIMCESKEDVFIQVTENFAINEKRKKVKINERLFDFSEITGVRIIEDGINTGVASKLNSNTNLILGTSKQLITKLDLEIELDHFDNPFINISFLKLGIRMGADKKSKKYQNAYKEVQTCLSILNKIIRDNEKIKSLSTKVNDDYDT